ncbi:hypothetical protein CAAN1_19S00496 [[Candida] anglica]|uniref:Uncharacterized protein n=1 Tax=[Candida] anglica TaxID=148631 RepID=A0ABP0E5M0_9ASCO
MPPRLVAHGVPAERLAAPQGKEKLPPYGVWLTLRWPLLGKSHCVVPSSSTRSVHCSCKHFLGRGTRPPRSVAHGVPAERLAVPQGRGWYHSMGSGLRFAGPSSGRATAWCLAPLRGVLAML